LVRLSSSTWKVVLDRVVLGALAAGLALYVVPWWREGRLAPAFWLTFAATLLHVYTSRRPPSSEGT